MILQNKSLFINPHLLRDDSGWIGHIPFAGWIIEALKPRIFVELGTQSGLSYSAFCQAVVENNLSTKCYAVDTWEGDEFAGYYDEKVYTEFSTYNEEHFASFSDLLRMTFDDALKYFSDGSIDLLHIDGRHSYEAVKHDFELWKPKVSERGIILFHDITVRERGFGVWKLWEELSRQYPFLEFKHWHGLGVLLVGKNIPEQIISLLSADSIVLNELFSRLGETFAMSVREHSNNSKLSDLKQIVKNQENQLQELNDTLEKVGDWSQKLDKELKEKNEYMLEILKEHEELLLSNSAIEKESDDKTVKLVELNKELEKVGIRMKILNKEQQEKQKNILELQKECDNIKKDLIFQQKSNKSKLDSKAKIINELYSKLADNNNKIIEIVDSNKELREKFETKDKKLVESLNNLELLDNENVSLKKELRTFESIQMEQKSKIIDLTELTSKLHDENKNTITLVDEKNQLIADYNSKITAMENDLTEKNNSIAGLNKHLSTKNKELQNFHNSKTFKILYKYQKVLDTLLPQESRRRKFVGSLKNPLGLLNKMKEISESTSSHSSDSYNKIIFDKFDEVKVSIIIPVYEKFDYTYNCLKSIKNNTQGCTYEIIVIDDCSNDLTKNLSDIVENIKVIRNTENLGFLKNCNRASEHSCGEHIVILNNDTLVEEDWLNKLVEVLDNNKEAGIVGPKLLYPDRKLQEAGGIIWSDGSGWNYGKMDDPEKPEYNYVKEVDYVSGACLLIRLSLWKKIGGFDERYAPAYYEDSDLAFEVRKQGFKVIYQPKSTVIHLEGISCGTDENAGIKKYQSINKEKFIEKWHSVLIKEQFAPGKDVFLARERNRNKNNILVIDHMVPTYDQDSGSRRLFQYLNLYIDLGYIVKFLPDNFYRFEPYVTGLEELGIEVFYGPYFSNNYQMWLKENSRIFDYVYLNRPVCIKYIDLIKETSNAVIIYDSVDLHYLRETRMFKKTKDKKILESARKIKKIEYDLFNKSDVVLTVSSFEKKLLERKIPGKPVFDYPNFIYNNKLPLDKEYSDNSFENKTDLTFVGGFNHPPNEDGVMWFIEDIFPLVLEKIPSITFNIIGSNVPENILKLKLKNINVTGFVPDEMLTQYYAKTRVVCVPLRFGAGVKGKVIEAIAYGIPVVTTSVGGEGIIENEKVFDIANTAKEFADKIINLYNNKQNWIEIRNSQIEYAEKNLSFKAGRKVFEEIISLMDMNRT